MCTPSRAGIWLAIWIPLLSMTWAAGTGAAYTLRSPQVAFDSVALQGVLDAWDGGIRASTDQVDVQVLSLGAVDRSFVAESRRGGGLEFGVYDPLEAGAPARCPLFTTTSGGGGFAFCQVASETTLVVQEYDSLAVLIRFAKYRWAGQGTLAFYAAGPGGTWYSQDNRNAGIPHALTFAGSGANARDLLECFEPGDYDAATPGAFARLVVLLQFSSCHTASSRTSRALGVECSPTVISTWGGLKVIYR